MKSSKIKKTRVKSKLHLRKKHKNHRKTHKGGLKLKNPFKSLFSSKLGKENQTVPQEQPRGSVATKIQPLEQPTLSANIRKPVKPQESPLTPNLGEVVYTEIGTKTLRKNHSNLYATVGPKTQKKLAQTQFPNYRTSSTPQVSNESHYETVEDVDNQSLPPPLPQNQKSPPRYATTGKASNPVNTTYAVAQHVLNPPAITRNEANRRRVANLPSLMSAMHGNQLYLTNTKARGQEPPLYEVIYPDTAPNGLIGPGLNNYNKRKASLELLKTVIDCNYYTIGLQSNKQIEYELPYIIQKLDEHYPLKNIDLFLKKFSEQASEKLTRSAYKGNNCEVPEDLRSFLEKYAMKSKKGEDKRVMSLFTPNEKPGLQRRGAVVNQTTRTKTTKPIVYASLNLTGENPSGKKPSIGNRVEYAEIKHVSQSNEPVYQTVEQAQAAPRNLYQTVEQAMSGNNNESSTNGNQYTPNPMGHNSPTTIAMQNSPIAMRNNRVKLTPVNLRCETSSDKPNCLAEQARFEKLRLKQIEKENPYPVFYSNLYGKLFEKKLIGTSLGKRVNDLKVKKCFTDNRNKNTMACNGIIRELTPKLCGEKKWYGDEKKAYTLCRNLVKGKQSNKEVTNSTA